MSNELQVMTFNETKSIAAAMAQSGYFADSRDVNQAIVKIFAGQELGLGPFAAMTGIHIIKGKPVMSANLIATLIKNDPRYDYQVGRLDNDGCTIVFFENGEAVGESSFTADDAKLAGLSGDNWRKFPKNMYFARAISNGAKWYTPGIFGGAPTYTPDELGAEIDGETGEIVTIDVTPQRPERPQVIEAEIIPDNDPLADIIAMLDEFNPLTLASVAQVGQNIAGYKAVKHVENALALNEAVIEHYLIDDNGPDWGKKISRGGAVKLLRWLADRKQ